MPLEEAVAPAELILTAGPSNHKSIIDSTLAPPATGTNSEFSTSLSTWREVNFANLQGNLETICSPLIISQKDALLSRKRLAEQTRDFRKLAPENQGEAIKPLLKSYQTEIDNLTKRAKAAESAILSIRDRLQNVNDPYPILEAILEQTASVNDLTFMKEKIEQLQEEIASLDSQSRTLSALEKEKVRLDEKVIQLEARFENRVKEMRKTIEAEVSAKWDERIRNYQMREQDLSKSLETSQAQLKEIRVNYAKVTERLLQHGEEVEREQTNGKLEELEVISEELSRSNERVSAMERRNEQLRQEIERLKSASGEEDQRREYERRQQEIEDENMRLARLLEEEGIKLTKYEDESKRQIQSLEAQLAEKDKDLIALRRRLQSMSDYDELKRELKIFKYVEFAVESGLDDHEGDQMDEKRAASTSAKPLEALLIEKNRQLQEEVTNMRVSKTEIETVSLQVQKDFENANDEVKRLKELNERLEDDLVNMKPGQQVANRKEIVQGMSAEEALAEMDQIANDTSKENGKQVTKAVTSKHSPLLIDSATKGSVTRNANNTDTISSSSSSILPIITSQRDRFRARNAELEEELRKQFDTISQLRNEVKTLQADNLSLYEKMRYLQAYGNNAGIASPSYRGPGGGSRIVNVSAKTDQGSYPPTDKYRDKYEAAMNPFEQFRGREQSRAFNSLNPFERILHMLTRLVVGHRRMRIFFIVYAIALHFLVFAMLFEIEFYSSSPSENLQAITPAQPAI